MCEETTDKETRHPAEEGAAEALRESRALLSGIIESAMDAIITVDSEQRVLLFNHAAEQMFRAKAADAVGQPLERFVPARFRGTHKGHIEEFGRTGVATRAMGKTRAVSGLRADGEEFPVGPPSRRSRSGAGSSTQSSCATSRSACAPKRN